MDYCNLSNARSISVANEIQALFADPEFEDEVGTLHINVKKGEAGNVESVYSLDVEKVEPIT